MKTSFEDAPAPEVANFVPEDTSVELSWLEAQHQLNIEALGQLGFAKQNEIPTYDKLQANIPYAARVLLALRRVQGAKDNLVIAPSAQAFGLFGTADEPGIITRFDQGQSDDTKTMTLSDAWAEHDDRAPIHDNGRIGKFYLGILLGDVMDPLESQHYANRHEEPGLVYVEGQGLFPVSKTTTEQRTNLNDEQQRAAEMGLIIDAATIGQIIINNAMLRTNGQTLLDGRDTSTKLIHYPDNRAGVSNGIVPTICAPGGQLELGQSGTYSLYSDSLGVRRALRVSLNADV